MSRANDRARNFARLLKKITKSPAKPPQDVGDPVAVLVMSFLMWNCTSSKAATAYKRLMDHIVDFNDLRVSMPHEMVELIGSRYPLALERCQRMRATLRHTYKREHAVSLERLAGLPKREIKNYARSLDGIDPYVADRVTLLCFGTHSIPVDNRLRRALVGADACEESMETIALGSWLARQVKAADALDSHYALQAWVDRVGDRAPATASTKGATRPRRKAAGALRTKVAGSRAK